MTTKDELKAEIEALRSRIDALPDDEQPWEPSGGPWSIINNGIVIHSKSSPDWAAFGTECRTGREAIALRNRMYARNRIDTWIREHGGEGKWVIRFPVDESVASACLPIHGPAVGELTTDRRSAKRCADLINCGLINLQWPGMT